MNSCEECIFRIDLYLDGELREDELDIFNRHLSDCSSCREKLAARQQFLNQIRSARPLHVLSPELRVKLAALMPAEPPDYQALPALHGHTDSMKVKGRKGSRFRWFRTGPVPALVACGLTIVGAALLWSFSVREMRATAFVDAAEKTYRQQLAGRLPFEVTTSSPAEMSAWFANKVLFHFRLPNYQDGSGQDPKYKLSGGRLITFRNDNAAYIAYRMKTQLVGLLVVSASSSAASGGEETVSKSLTFHTHRRHGLQVVTWSVHNLTYALVSDVNMPSSQSCAVCHPSAKDRGLIGGIKSRNRPAADAQGVMLLSIAEIRHLLAVQ